MKPGVYLRAARNEGGRLDGEFVGWEIVSVDAEGHITWHGWEEDYGSRYRSVTTRRARERARSTAAACGLEFFGEWSADPAPADRIQTRRKGGRRTSPREPGAGGPRRRSEDRRRP